MIGRTNAGGAGGGLNFSVKAYATEEALLAATPKENTVGVVTETAIPDWYFSASEPSEPSEGTVFVQTGTESDAAFNALKKNYLLIYPVSCLQFLNGTWENMQSSVYKNGAWVSLESKSMLIGKLDGTGWAKYSENTAGEYVRLNGRGFTRNSVLPAIWCWAVINNIYYGYCLIAASRDALAAASVTSYGSIVTTTLTTPAGNTLYVGYMKDGWRYNSEAYDLTITSDGSTKTLEYANMGAHYYDSAANTLDADLAYYADRLLF